MPRKRKNPQDSWLPERVYRGKSAYEWRPLDGKFTNLMPLARDENGKVIEPPEVKRQLLEAYEKVTSEIQSPNNMGYWLTKFMVSAKFLQLGSDTQRDYTRYIEVRVDPDNPKSKATHNGIRHVFGNMNPLAVRPTHIRRYMDYWNSPREVHNISGKVFRSDGSPTTANRHLTCLQTFFKWLRQYVSGLEVNPADNIIRFPEKQRQVLITDDQLISLLDAALESSTPYIFSFIEMAYLCGLRLHEVCNLNIDDIVEENGIRYLTVRRGKGSRGELVEISDRLQSAIDFAIGMHPKDRIEPLRERPLIRSTRGDRITRSAANNAWQNLRQATGLHNLNIHDLKKKAGTDGKDLGHRTNRMKELYNLKLSKGKATR